MSTTESQIDMEALAADLDVGMEAAQNTPIPGELPIGKYVAKIAGTTFTPIEPNERNANGATKVTVALEVVSADPVNDEIDPSDLIGEVVTEDFWLSKDAERQGADFQRFRNFFLSRVGISAAGGAELIRDLNNLTGRHVRIARRAAKKGEYTNTYFNGLTQAD